MTIRARGNRLEYWINGIKVMDYRDPDPKGSREGVIGFQMHDGSVMKAEYRDIGCFHLHRRRKAQVCQALRLWLHTLRQMQGNVTCK